MKYKAIIFDLFGTLVDNHSVKEYKNMLFNMSAILEIEPAEFINEWWDSFEMRMLGRLKGSKENIEYICDKTGKKVSKDRIEKAAKIRLNFEKDALKPRKNCIKTLNKLIALNYKLGLISDCEYEDIILWKNTAFGKIFDKPVFSAEVGIKKPDIRIYQFACKNLNVEPNQCIYVGDGSSCELSGAANAGMKPIKIQVPYEMSKDTYRIDEDKIECRVIKSLNDLLNLKKIIG